MSVELTHFATFSSLLFRLDFGGFHIVLLFTVTCLSEPAGLEARVETHLALPTPRRKEQGNSNEKKICVLQSMSLGSEVCTHYSVVYHVSWSLQLHSIA